MSCKEKKLLEAGIWLNAFYASIWIWVEIPFMHIKEGCRCKHACLCSQNFGEQRREHHWGLLMASLTTGTQRDLVTSERGRVTEQDIHVLLWPHRPHTQYCTHAYHTHIPHMKKTFSKKYYSLCITSYTLYLAIFI